ncbi:MAG: DNA sulfur modification protein DndD [Nitrosopumilaceae archaeon]|nr:DNA sulfur modification protein DndD [Nitrosopumilaceae archaeon]
MQFTRLILENYGVYGGTTDIDLRPEPDKPVILFGGRNGAGKTTLFESLLVCLYGASSLRMMRAATTGSSGGGRREYERLLVSRIHRGRGGSPAAAAGSASITVRFAAFIGGEGVEYDVRRSWRAAAAGGKNSKGGKTAGNKISESLAVGRRPANAPDETPFEPVDMESRWQSFIMDLAPPATAGLFFFDGERVPKIARQYGGYAGEAFKSALGLDVVERLQADLLANGARESAGSADGGGKDSGNDGGPPAKYAELEAERARHDLERRHLAEMLDQKSAELAELRAEVAAAEQRAAAFQKGGDSGDGQNADALLERARLELEDTERRILEACESCEAPLRLLPDRLMSDVVKWFDGHWDVQVQKFAAEAADAVVSTIRECVESDCTMPPAYKSRMIRILDKVASGGSERRRAARGGKGKGASTLQPLPPAVSALLALRTLKAAAAAKKDRTLRELCSDHASLHTRTGELESERSIRERGGSERKEAVRELTALASRAGTMSADVRRLESDMRAHAAAARAANSRMRDALKRARKRGGSTRKAELRAGVLDALESFRSRMQSSRTRRLEDALLQNMRILMHKDAVERVEVDAENGFAIRLYGPVAGAGAGAGAGNDADDVTSTDPAACLSEGERQMFAVSVMWALAQTSGRPLPFVVDTPLARLDMAHRSSMTREFLPGCSHQVLVLSTDSEIDRERLAELGPRVARSYTLEYDEAEGSASCRPGYFWHDDDRNAGADNT